MYQRIGAAAYHKDLNHTIALCDLLQNPQNKYPTIHIAGTNGKGSVAHMLAAVLQAAGYKTGLYISPHYKDFRERIKINGKYIAKNFIVDFVEKYAKDFETIKPSFFEMTVGMAFAYFADQKVDIAVIETGLGGRLDSTNIITPILSVITNISYDHMNLLGNTLQEIAVEKAGIIKPNIPVVIGEEQPETKEVFQEKAKVLNAPITFASQTYTTHRIASDFDYTIFQTTKTQYGGAVTTIQFYKLNIGGAFQEKNLATVLQAIDQLKQHTQFKLQEDQVRNGLHNLKKLTKFMGRWQKIGDNPTILCDSAHNTGGLEYTMKELSTLPANQLHIVLGMVNDKDINKMLSLFPKNAIYYFAKANIPRGMEAQQLQTQAETHGLKGKTYKSVKKALAAAKDNSTKEDLIYIGGSTFVVAEIL